jgi:hypothetical protein
MNTITLEQTRDTIDVNGVTQYRVNNTVVATEGLPLQLFVNRVEPDAYSHIATVTDIQDYPADRNEAINAGLDFYRRPDATKTYSQVGDANHFAHVVREQLTYLVSAYSSVEAEFAGQDTFVISDG